MTPPEGTPLLHGEVTECIIGAFYDVYNKLGHGLAEAVYERALANQLRQRGLEVVSQQGTRLTYGRERFARFRPDLLVNGKVLVEIKARSRILKSHWAQLLHYLTVSGIEVGLILNFGPRPGFKRLVLTGTGRERVTERTNCCG